MNTARFVFKSLIKRWTKKIFPRENNRKRELEPEWTSQGPGSILMERYHHIDASEQDKDGLYDYYYEYDMYYFTEGTLSLVARCYTDDADRADFMGIEFDGYDRALEPDDRSLPLVSAALAQLKADGKTTFFTFTGKGYEPIFAGNEHESHIMRRERIEVIALSPSARYRVQATPYEALATQWIYPPEIIDIRRDIRVFAFEDNGWSADQARWLDCSCVELTLRKYPGRLTGAGITVIIDCARGTAVYGNGIEIKTPALERALDAMLSGAG
ncbi:hypothetical protein CCL09_02565 [Pseudomonas congelans]|uniref:hypothetical protein n=1 Tax=Pseudomonas congelans TaxID=200452 RepID=UPI000BB5F4BE|nr:hypothetical protein [Pseudomonas congelans]PBQ20647.1 hypothetical protein CCL09_02565 [Pseudomonas congelans]